MPRRSASPSRRAWFRRIGWGWYVRAVSTPIVQIYTIQTVAEARAVAALGIDRIGVTPATRGLPGEISTTLASSIVDAIRDDATVSALSVDTDPDAIVSMVETVRPHVLHLCGPPGAVPPEAVAALRERLGGIEIMQAIAVVGEEAIATATAYADVSDSLILDSVSPDVEGVGAAGVVHDWNTSRRIVEAVDIPVILAGGLSPANVADAIAAVGPWGVDSLTHTNLALPDGGFRKDLDAVAAFADAARGVGS
jgi:phosphoribosylanthranilate isomerase